MGEGLDSCAMGHYSVCLCYHPYTDSVRHGGTKVQHRHLCEPFSSGKSVSLHIYWSKPVSLHTYWSKQSLQGSSRRICLQMGHTHTHDRQRRVRCCTIHNIKHASHNESECCITRVECTACNTLSLQSCEQTSPY